MSASDRTDPAASDPTPPALTSADTPTAEAAATGAAADTGAAAASSAAVPPEALPYDGVASVAAGTVLWAIAAVIGLIIVGDLRDDGHLWWLATALCGFGLGLLGLWVVIRRRNRLRSAHA
ncbi:DUF2530 domain-containing protein [Frankia sp. R82]|uniref:DUF2530 domain-containing protein n=1 Tax=Frankia sp. R82 TaxID=2950553 RepID=UPI00204459C9|nr:DUF2530 domain-containing protein [Frankia sp. R82]MCM3887073.1 DUF2530 domain-containing protein [Frankia sp. R82]